MTDPAQAGQARSGFVASLMIATGALIALLCGSCTGVFLAGGLNDLVACVTAQGGACSRLSYAYQFVPVPIYFGLAPTLLGITLLSNGLRHRWLSERAFGRVLWLSGLVILAAYGLGTVGFAILAAVAIVKGGIVGGSPADGAQIVAAELFLAVAWAVPALGGLPFLSEARRIRAREAALPAKGVDS